MPDDTKTIELDELYWRKPELKGKDKPKPETVDA
jgi:hypothetical protein